MNHPTSICESCRFAFVNIDGLPKCRKCQALDNVISSKTHPGFFCSDCAQYSWASILNPRYAKRLCITCSNKRRIAELQR